MTISSTAPAEFPRLSVAIPIFDGFTALDAVGPYEVLQRIPQLTPTFVSESPGLVETDNGFLRVQAAIAYEQMPHPDVIVFPGGQVQTVVEHRPTLEWLRRAHRTTRFTTSVCTGSLVLAAAGLLDGLTATTHWASTEYLRRFGALPVDGRVVEHLDERIVTAAGVSSGIDMALLLVARLTDELTAQAVQLQIEYDPAPPFDTGSTAKADEAIVERALQLFQHRR